MASGLKKTILGLFILSVILFTTGFLLFKTTFSAWYFKFFPWLVLIFFLVNSGFFVYFYRALDKSDKHFIHSFILSKGVKLIIYLLLVLSYILLSPKSAVPFAVTLSILYIAFTIYDLYIMVSLVKRKKEITSLPN